jgi:DNA-binding response OmpR family regulator
MTLRILVVEDNATIGALLAEMLIEMGHAICAIEVTGAGAVNAAARDKPDLIIVDVQLGDGDGISTAEAICRIAPIPYLLISGDISRVRNLEPGSVIIQKPFRETDLAHAIQRALVGQKAFTKGELQ